jgi:hypothetical protein
MDVYTGEVIVRGYKEYYAIKAPECVYIVALNADRDTVGVYRYYAKNN